MLKQLAWWHLVLGPVAVYILYQDATHPERWDAWYRNPSIAIPYCLFMEAFIWRAAFFLWLKHRNSHREIDQLREALRL